MTISESVLRKLTEELIHSDDIKKQILQRALVPTILQKILYKSQENSFIQIPINYTEKSFLKNSVYLFWYLLWSIKWIIFLVQRNKRKIITGSLFSGIKISRVSIHVISEMITKGNIIFLNFGMLQDFSLLVSSKIFCHPYFFYKWKTRDSDDKYCVRLNTEIKNTLRKHIGDDTSESYISALHHLVRYYNVIDDFLFDIKKYSSIHFYISDTDHLDTRSIICNLHKKYGVKTVLIDHALNAFSQINKHIYSDIYYCWGNYHYERCRKNLPNYCSNNKISIVGNPVKKFTARKPIHKGLWLYILPSFQHQTAFSVQRNLERTISFISEINAIAKAHYPQIEFMIKLHPVDQSDYSRLTTVRQNNYPLDKIIDSVELVFVEDSTSTIEVLQYLMPMIYVTNHNGEDLLNLEGVSGITFVRDTTTLNQQINFALNKKDNASQREQVFYYHFGQYDPLWTKLKQNLNKIISSENNSSPFSNL